MTPSDERLTAARHDVEQLFGRCLLQLQAFERLMKAILAEHQLSAPAAGLEDARAARVAGASRKTLGALVGEFMGAVLVPEGQEGPHAEREDALSVTLRSQIALPAADFARIEAGHRDLVTLRNTLVHNFLDHHDLRTEDGCLAARQSLTDALDRTRRAYADLTGWAGEMQRTRKILADLLASPDLRDFLVNGRIPWHLATIARALDEAALELAPGGWASVDAATRWIGERYPEEQPGGYGCRSWRQVIHEAGRFELQIRKVDGRRQAWYRPRNQQPGRV